MDADIASIAGELYALTPAEFTAARDARAAAVPDPTLARAITALRRPTVAAWVVGELTRVAPTELADALALAAELRDAQDERDARAMATLNRQRRSLVAALARKAAAAAAARGVAVSAAAVDAVEKTLNAAMRDERAAAAVLSGRLVRPLDASGLDPIDLTGAVGGGLDDLAPVPPPARPDDLAERRARKDAERAARDAERVADEAQRALARLDARRERERERAHLLAERVESLRAELRRVERDADDAATALAAVEQERRAAASAAARAATSAAQAASRAAAHTSTAADTPPTAAPPTDPPLSGRS